MQTLMDHFNTTDASWSQGDFTADGIVNTDDFTRFAMHFDVYPGTDTPTDQDWFTLASSVPEPTGLLIGVATSVAMSMRRRQAVSRKRDLYRDVSVSR